MPRSRSFCRRRRAPAARGQQPPVQAVDVVQQPVDGVARHHVRLARSPNAARSARSPASRSRAAAIARASPGGTSSPASPSATTSRTPPTSVETTGRPAASASISRHGRALVRRREHDDVRRRQVRPHVLAEADEAAASLDGRGSAPVPPGPSAAGRRRGARGRPCVGAGQGLEQQVDALDLGHAAHPQREDVVVAEAELAADPLALVRRGPRAAPEVDTQPDHLDPLGGRHPEPHEVVPHLVADGDQRVRPLREPRSRNVKRRVLPGPRSRSGRGRGRCARSRPAVRSRRAARRCAPRSRLGGVRMHDRRPLAADQPTQPQHAPQVRDGRDLTLQLRQEHRLDAPLARRVLHRGLADRHASRDERRGVAAPVEALGEVRDVERGPTHVEPRDRTQDRHPFRHGRRRMRPDTARGGLGEPSSCAAGSRWSHRGGVLSRVHMPAYGRSLRPCLGTPSAPRRRATIRQALLHSCGCSARNCSSGARSARSRGRTSPIRRPPACWRACARGGARRRRRADRDRDRRRLQRGGGDRAPAREPARARLPGREARDRRHLGRLHRSHRRARRARRASASG